MPLKRESLRVLMESPELLDITAGYPTGISRKSANYMVDIWEDIQLGKYKHLSSWKWGKVNFSQWPLCCEPLQCFICCNGFLFFVTVHPHLNIPLQGGRNTRGQCVFPIPGGRG